MLCSNHHTSDSGQQRRIKHIYSINNALFKAEDTKTFSPKLTL